MWLHGMIYSACKKAANGPGAVKENGVSMANHCRCYKLRGQLENCVNLLHRLKRHGSARDADAADAAIESANKVLYETSRQSSEGED